jgi:hypothetical protein
MPNPDANAWYWEQPDPMVSGSSGDLAKLFRNEAVRQPSVFAAERISHTATVMAREVIQNSWDAAHDLRRQMAAEGSDPPGFSIEFRYRELTLEQKRDLVDRLDLRGLRSHVTVSGEDGQHSNRAALGLTESDCLDHLDDDTPLTVLQVVESGASGMYGPFEKARSKLYLALISLGYTVKHEGAGGSFGFGKAGLIRGSRIHSLVAYTCFREQPDDPGVTRRLLGMSYWGQHDIDGVAYNGFARYGQSVEPAGRRPFENDDADAGAASLGLPLRTASDSNQLGSTFLLIDPVVDPDDLVKAVARSWWPALMESQFVVRVVTPDGRTLVPRPKSDRVLAPFLRGFELALTTQDNSIATEFAKELPRTTATGDSRPTGSIGLVADLNGWSYPNEIVHDEEDGGIAHRSLVALVRGPRMVVEYHETGTHPPFVRGAFVANDAIDDLLRQSEPMAHDRWQTAADAEGIDPAAPKVAAAVTRNVSTAVKEFRKRLKPPLPREEEIRLPLLQDLFRRILQGRSPAVPPPPPADKRMISIGMDQHIEPADDPTKVVLVANVRFALTAHVEGNTASADVRLSYRFVEDGRIGDECPLTVTAPPTFTATSSNGWRGVLTREPVAFQVRSAPYSGEWSGRLIADGELAATEGVEVGA